MPINHTDQLLALQRGELITKRNLYDLVQFSKIEGTEYWSGTDNIIGNTPQQGINWVGELPDLKAVIIKTRHGAYDADGWIDEEELEYRYSFKARNGIINLAERANQALVNQPKFNYPVLLFTESGNSWSFHGNFSVIGIEDDHVLLGRNLPSLINLPASLDEQVFREGNPKYVRHLVRERSREAVNLVKQTHHWICDICEQNFADIYGVRYIEAHHKRPFAEDEGERDITPEDFALLCPNCHKAVHLYIKNGAGDYDDVRIILRDLILGWL